MTLPIKDIELPANIEDIKEYVSQLLGENLSAHIYFHTLSHTERVLAAAKKLSNKAKLSDSDKELVQIAALFHSTGFINSYEDHLAQSIVIATAYLSSKNYPEEKIVRIERLIEATRADAIPMTGLQKLLRDATTSYVGKKVYFYYMELLRQEREHNEEDFNPTDIGWAKENFQFLQQHTFYTKHARALYQKRKNKNITKARKFLNTVKLAEKKRWENFSVAKNKAALTMFKTSLRNHIDLTAIADQKSNMMLSANALLLTIGLPIFASYLSEKVYLLVPSIIFMFTCITTMIFATLATRPMKMDGKTDLSKLHTNKTNLFFFGNFYSIPLEPYHEAIKKVITNRETLDTSIINDLYFLGHSLGDKFRYLRMCYNVFIVGISCSILAFLVSYYLMGN